MKKYLLKLSLVALIVVGLCSGVKYYTDLTVNGSIIKTDPTYTGTLNISHTANGQVSFGVGFPGGGTFLTAAGNSVDFSTSYITALYRGAIFSADVGGSVLALTTRNGNNNLNQNSGRTLVGQNVPDDGFSLFQVHGGLKTDSLRLSGNPGATGDVLTKQANGTYQPQTPSGGSGASGVFAPTMTLLSNLGTNSAIYANGSNYNVQGKIVNVEYSGQAVPITANATCVFTLTLPPGYTTWNGATNYAPVMISMNVPNLKMGLAQITAQNQITVSFTSTTANVAYAYGFTLQYSML